MGTIFKNVLLEDDTGGGCAAITDIFGMGNPSPTAFSYFSIVGEAFRLPLFDLHHCSVNRRMRGSLPILHFAFCIFFCAAFLAKNVIKNSHNSLLRTKITLIKTYSKKNKYFFWVFCTKKARQTNIFLICIDKIPSE